MTIQCGQCHKTLSPERAGRHSQTCKVAVSARVAEDRKARPAQYQPIPAPVPVAPPSPYDADDGASRETWGKPDPEGEALQDAAREYEDEHPGAVTQGMLFGEEWTR